MQYLMKLFMVSHLFCSKPCNVVHLKVLCWGNRRFCSRYQASTFSIVRVARKFLSQSIDLSTDMAAILNLLDLRSIMGCPGGTCYEVFTRTFRAKRELHCIFLGKKAITTISKHGKMIFFPITIFFQENLKKNWPEKRAKILSEFIGSCSYLLNIR